MKSIDKYEIAKEMLDAAIEEYLDHGRLYAAYNLAGVAEELFGKFVRLSGGKDSLSETVETIKALSQKMGWEVDEDRVIKKTASHTKNSIKHMNSENDQHVVVNIKDEARWKIADAISNFDKLKYEHTKNIDRFFEYRKEKLHHNKAPRPTV